MEETQDLNVQEVLPLVTPAELKEEWPMNEKVNRAVVKDAKKCAES